MRLMYSPIRQAFLFMQGDSPVQFAGEPMSFPTKKSAIDAAKKKGLTVDKKGYVKSDEMLEMEALLARRGYNPADAEILMSEGMGPEELKSRLRHAPGTVGSLEHSHKLEKVRRDAGLNGAEAHTYHVAVINDKTGRKYITTPFPVTHKEAVTIKSKYTPHKHTRFVIVESDSPDIHDYEINVTPMRGKPALEGSDSSLDLDAFTTQYLETALWSSLDNDDTPLDKKFGVEDFSPESVEKAVADCKAFQEANQEDIQSDPGQAGHDFWLTRNGHGAGFWDGDWPEAAAKRLTKASKSFGELYLIVGDDGKVHIG